MNLKPSIRLNHAGFHVFDIDRMVDFFTSVYGLHVTDRGVVGETGGSSSSAPTRETTTSWSSTKGERRERAFTTTTFPSR